jgi:aryl-alcohol dehydrogenase-like predicted oxidoreductase
MKDAQAAGKVKFLGASPGNDVLQQCIDSGDFDVLQIGYSLLDKGAKTLISKAADNGIGVLIRSGFAGGWLTPRVLAVPDDERPESVRTLLDLVNGNGEKLHALALSFLRAHAGITSILVGSKNLKNFRRNIELFTGEHDGELLQRALQVL